MTQYVIVNNYSLLVINILLAGSILLWHTVNWHGKIKRVKIEVKIPFYGPFPLLKETPTIDVSSNKIQIYNTSVPKSLLLIQLFKSTAISFCRHREKYHHRF